MKRLLTVLLVAYWPLTPHAATPGVPDAGLLLQKILPLTLPSASSKGSGLLLEQTDGSRTPLPDSEPILIRRIRITRNTLFDTNTLLALVAHAEGQALTLPQLGELAAIITTYYRSHGYPLSRAIIPAQSIASGLVRIEIIEAHYGEIRLDNSSQVRDVLLQAILSKLKSGQDISQVELDYVLLLMSDLAAVKADARLKPGRMPGTSDLVVVTEPGPVTSGSVTQDNSGDSFTGRTRTVGTVNINNPLNRGDTLTAGGMSSGTGLNYARLSYEAVLNGLGARMGGAYSSLNYSLGGAIAPLRANGTAQEARLWLRQPLLLARDKNIYGRIQYEGLKLRDHVDVNNTHTDRSLKNWTLNLSGDRRDKLLSGGISSWSLSWTTGRVAFDDAVAQSVNAETARSQGQFSKWMLNLEHLQGLNRVATLDVKFAAQQAGTNLDSSQKFSPTGPLGVRAYGPSAISGDIGYMLNTEFRYDLGREFEGQLQAIAFIDSAHVIVNKNPWVSGPNSATLSGAGFGINWAGPSQWTVRTTIAAPFGPRPQLLGTTRSVRLWAEVGKGF